MFSGLSNRIQNDINEASFVATEADEMTDVTQKAQISVIFSFCN